MFRPAANIQGNRGVDFFDEIRFRTKLRFGMNIWPKLYKCYFDTNLVLPLLDCLVEKLSNVLGLRFIFN